MAKDVPIGISGRSELTVEPKHTLHHHNPALPLIFSTPDMIGMMEWAAANAMLPYCEDGEISVGTAINIEHRAPATVGQKVAIDAILESRKGRFYIFRVTAHNGLEEIGRGTVTRTFVNPKNHTSRAEQGGATR